MYSQWHALTIGRFVLPRQIAVLIADALTIVKINPRGNNHGKYNK